jgi:hypothetical protein
MARTYYKYAEKQADSQVNWFEIGKGLTDMLKAENEIRENKKAAINEASRQFGQELEEAPTGNSDDVNQWTTSYAADMQQYRLMTDRLLKSGQMKVKDYTLIRQNTMDGTKNLFNLSKEYQAEFDEKSKRRDEDISSASEGQFMAMVEGFANLSQTKALINPTNGAISVGRMEKGEDGVMRLKEGTDNYMTVNQLRNRIKEKIDKYKLNDALEAESKLLGEVVTEVVSKTGSSTQTGFMTKITDPTKRTGLSQEGQSAVDAYIKTENQIIEAKLSNPRHVSSVLFDWTGGVDPKTNKAYQVVTDPKLAETSSHYVLWTHKDGLFQPDFESTANGKAQKEEAATYVKNKLRSMLEQKTEMQAFSQPGKQYAPQYVYDAGNKNKTDLASGNMIAKLYSGTPAEQQSAITYFGGLPNVRSVTRDNDGIVVTLADGVIKTIPFKNPANDQLMTQDDFVRSASSLLIGGDADINQVLKGALGTGSKNFATGTAGVSATSNNPSELYNEYISSVPINISTDEAEAVRSLNPTINKLGFSAREARAGQDFVVIKNKDGLESEPIDLSDLASATEAIKSFMVGNVPGKTEKDKLIFLNQLFKSGITKPATGNKTGTIQGGKSR